MGGRAAQKTQRLSVYSRDHAFGTRWDRQSISSRRSKSFRRCCFARLCGMQEDSPDTPAKKSQTGRNGSAWLNMTATGFA
jgi:hypothetical protein